MARTHRQKPGPERCQATEGPETFFRELVAPSAALEPATGLCDGQLAVQPDGSFTRVVSVA